MAAAPIVNPSFETGNFDGWIIESTGTVNYSVSNSENTPYGTWALRFTTGTPGVFYLLQDEFTPVYPGKSITASCNYSQGPAAANLNTGRVVLKWYDENDVQISESPGTLIFSTGANGWAQGRGFVQSQVTAAAPAGAVKVKIGLWCNKDRNDWCNVDNFVWNYALPDVTLTYPINNSTYAGGAEVPFRIEVELEGATIESVEYVATNTDTADETVIGPVTEAAWGTNFAGLAEGPYSAIARVTFVGGLVRESAPKTFTVGPLPAPDTREFKASNSYTNLVAKNFVGLASAMPPTAQVVGMQTIVDYYIQALIRSKDLGVSDLTVARYDAAFEMVPTVTFETVLLDDNGTSYTSVGGSATAQEEVVRSDFSVTEDGISEAKRWTVLEGDPQQVTIGETDELFGIESMTASEFITKALGLRFYPNLATKPDYADSGDACFRVNLDKLRVQIYFDAGSVFYYFVSPDGTQVIRGRLAAAYVDSGAFANGDAAGIMQLASDLETILGTATTIQEDWTIHSAEDISPDNQIGVVSADMSYNGLPPYWDVEDNRSRYQFISANFYGDLSYDSIYGVNGVDRAFSYNGDFFYKIHTQPGPAKDKPRHVEFYHTHLALGYGEGRVDVSVVGEPYNFNGVDGASSWAIGDSVTGLLNMSGTMLGIFCKKSIHALAGTTVDNFSTQVLSPKIGAVEYTTTDMGFPVYANAYGIYTLAQTEKYGSYLGTPMSQDVSPWLRPRLVRKYTSPREVVVAWPVRSKNQYRLAFADGYVLTMTMNNGLQEAPTFSKQKYFLAEEDVVYTSLYDQPAIVPAAISSELDDSGEERIHIAAKDVNIPPPEPPPEPQPKIKLVGYMRGSQAGAGTPGCPFVQLPNGSLDTSFVFNRGHEEDLDRTYISQGFVGMGEYYVFGGTFLIGNNEAPYSFAASIVVTDKQGNVVSYIPYRWAGDKINPNPGVPHLSAYYSMCKMSETKLYVYGWYSSGNGTYNDRLLELDLNEDGIFNVVSQHPTEYIPRGALTKVNATTMIHKYQSDPVVFYTDGTYSTLDVAVSRVAGNSTIFASSESDSNGTSITYYDTDLNITSTTHILLGVGGSNGIHNRIAVDTRKGITYTVGTNSNPGHSFWVVSRHDAETGNVDYGYSFGYNQVAPSIPPGDAYYQELLFDEESREVLILYYPEDNYTPISRLSSNGSLKSYITMPEMVQGLDMLATSVDLLYEVTYE